MGNGGNLGDQGMPSKRPLAAGRTGVLKDAE